MILDGAQRVLTREDGTAAWPGCSADLLPRSDRARHGDEPARQCSQRRGSWASAESHPGLRAGSINFRWMDGNFCPLCLLIFSL